MNRTKTKNKYIQRAEAYEDAAKFLIENPVDDPEAQEQSVIVAKRIAKIGAKMRRLAEKVKTP